MIIDAGGVAAITGSNGCAAVSSSSRLQRLCFVKCRRHGRNTRCAAGGFESELKASDIKDKYLKWEWRGHSINYLTSNPSPPSLQDERPPPPPLLLVHGFGASIPHWRRNIGVLSQYYPVYAIDLLGFGASDKPPGFAYTMEAWSQLLLDFITQVVHKPTVLIGNSVGSLACVIAASEPTNSLVKGLVLLNCSGGMNNKAVVDDWRIKLLLPLLWLVDFLLKQRGIATAIFERVKQRENLRNILLSVYGNKSSVDDELVEIIKGPADDEGALDAFVSIVTGPPGPNPVKLIPNISVPVLVLWGDNDPFTPIDGPVGRFFSSLPSQSPNINLFVLEGVGHCPHDDRPDLVHEKLLPWLASLPDLRAEAVPSSSKGNELPRPTGIKKHVVKTGNGPKPVRGQSVTVHCTGFGKDGDLGKKFWSTKDPGQQPFTFKIGQGEVIRGWDEGVMGMQVGEVARLECSPDYGYGPSGFPAWGIQPNAVLIFEIEVLRVR